MRLKSSILLGLAVLAMGSTASALTGADAISFAQQWVTAELLYCQSANHEPDYDTSCSSVCEREDNPAWDPYRSDCSGFVSWAWQLPSPGRVTDEFAPFETDNTSAISADSLQPGDAANRNSGGHMVLFEKWVTLGSEAVHGGTWVLLIHALRPRVHERGLREWLRHLHRLRG